MTNGADRTRRHSGRIFAVRLLRGGGLASGDRPAIDRIREPFLPGACGRKER